MQISYLGFGTANAMTKTLGSVDGPSIKTIGITIGQR